MGLREGKISGTCLPGIPNELSILLSWSVLSLVAGVVVGRKAGLRVLQVSCHSKLELAVTPGLLLLPLKRNRW